MATERLRVILELEAGQYKREAREAATATGKIGAEATKTAQQTEGATTRMSTSFKGVATAAAGFLAIGAVAEFGSFVRATTDDASELDQAIGGVEAVFGSLADEILRASEQAADS